MLIKPQLRVGLIPIVLLQLSLVRAAVAADLAPTFVGRWPPHEQGEAMGVAVVGTIAYVADGFAGLQVIDVSDPTQPKWLSGYNTERFAGNVTVVENIAYVAGGGFLKIIDVREPTQPKWLGEYNTGEIAYDVAVAGGIAYIADGFFAGLRVIDISDPAQPRLLATDRTSGAVRAVVVLGDTAYTAGGYEGGLSILDVSRPDQPSRLGGYSMAGAAVDVDVSSERNTAYLAGGNLDEDLGKYVDGLLIIDVSNPAEPRRLGGYTTDGECSSVTVVGNIAYVTVRYSGIHVLDVSDSANPRRLGQIDWMDGNVAVAGNRTYVAAGGAGLQIFEVRDPAQITRLGAYHTTVSVFGVAVADVHAYAVGNGLFVLDLREPTTPRLIGWDDTWLDNRDVKVVDRIAYVAARSGGILTYDVATPSRPRLLGRYQPGAGEARCVELIGNTAYVVGTRWHETRQFLVGALQLIDVSNPAELKSIGWCEIGWGRYGVRNAQRVAVSGSVACVADGEAGLGLIDVSDPRQPRQIGSYETSESRHAMGVAVVSNFCYVASTAFLVIDISDPTNPRRLWIDESANGANVAVIGNLAYVSGQSLHVFDISNPTEPRRISNSPFWGPNGIAAGNGSLLLAANGYGLSVLSLIHEARFDFVETASGDPLRLRVKGTPGVGGVVQRSNDLRGWHDWQPIVLGETAIELTDTPNAAQQFYRVALPP